MKKIAIALLVLALSGLGYGLYLYNKPLEGVEHIKTDVQITSSDLLKAFEEDETEANQKFLDKIIEVSGVVKQIETKNEKQSIHLETENELSNVIVQMEGPAQLTEGNNITLKGVCTGYLMDVVLVRGTLIN